MSDARPHVLVITRNLPPLLGGMERLNQRMIHSLVSDYNVGIIGPAGCGEYFRGDTVDVVEVPHRPLWRFILHSLVQGMRLARRKRPQIVIAGSGLTAPATRVAAAIAGARSVVYLHGLDLTVPNRLYRACWLPFVRRMDLALANSRNTARLAFEKGVAANRLQVLHPGTDLPAPDPVSGRNFRRDHGFGARPILLSVGRLTRRKGLAEFVKEALPAILSTHPQALLLVIGEEASNALNASADSERERIMESARKAGMADAVRILPHCDEAVLSAAFRAADVYVFPVLAVPGDVEGFGMVAIEAAAHGLPTVAFGVGGVPDAVIEGQSGSLVAERDYDGFASRIGYWLSLRDEPEVATRCVEAAAPFGWDVFGQQLRELLQVRLGDRQ